MSFEKKSWRLDRRIPPTFVLVFILQIAGILIWATTLDARVSEMEGISDRYINVHEKFVRLEERLDSIRNEMADIKRQITRLTEKLIK